MAEIESIAAIWYRWKAEGRTFRAADVTKEWERQGREVLREIESSILADAEHPDASDHTRAMAEQIRDHRAAGNHTTQG